MHLIPQHLPQSIVENMREGVVWQDALPPLLVSLADHLVPDSECAISLTYVKHIARSDLHARKRCEHTIYVFIIME